MTTLLEPEIVLHNGLPIARQIENQVREHILAGRLRPGDQLPTVRAVAVELGVNPATVLKAYADLEQQGFVTQEEGSGTFVASPFARHSCAAETTTSLENLCAEFLGRATRAGFAAEDVLCTLQELTERRTAS